MKRGGRAEDCLLTRSKENDVEETPLLIIDRQIIRSSTAHACFQGLFGELFRREHPGLLRAFARHH